MNNPYETDPVMMLDSFEAFDTSHIVTLIEYINKYTDYLVIALLPKNDASSTIWLSASLKSEWLARSCDSSNCTLVMHPDVFFTLHINTTT